MRPSEKRRRRSRRILVAIVVIGWPLAIVYGAVLAQMFAHTH